MVVEAFRSSCIKVRPGALPQGDKPSQLIWEWAPAFSHALNLLDADQTKGLRLLLGGGLLSGFVKREGKMFDRAEFITLPVTILSKASDQGDYASRV